MAKDKDAWSTKDPDYRKGYEQGKTERKTTEKLNKESDRKK
jgi:hypothetical protein